MKALLALATAVFVVTATPALAAGQTVKFTSGVYTNPSWTTATVVQAFTTGQTSGSALVTGKTTAPAIGDAKVGTNTVSIRNTTRAGMTGNYLRLRASGANTPSSYTVNFNATTGVQFVSFVLGNYRSTQSVVVQYVTGAVNTVNLLTSAGLTGLTAGASGRFYVDRGGSSGIKSITFANTSTTATNSMYIDSITAATPEPAAWMMMIFGFGLVGAQLRRRRATVKFTAA